MSENGILSRFWIQELTRPDFEDWLENEEAPTVIIGIGSVEQHGPHLPLGTDSLAIREYIHEIAKRTNSVCVHPCWPGYSPHHMGFPGTITFSEDTFIGVLMDTISSLSAHGIKRCVIVNGHGGNTNIMNLVVQVAKRDYAVMVTAPSGCSDKEAAEIVEDRQKRYWDVHSGVNETGIALALFPELVEMNRLDGWEPTLDVHGELMSYLDPDRDDYEMVRQIFRASQEPYTDDFTSSGVYGINDPREADPGEMSRLIEGRIDFVTKFINKWKTIPLPDHFKD